jgi:type IX secretion system PorP/SprF family membrane protein
MKSKLALPFILFTLLSGLEAFAQDPQFTQIYSAPIYLNPAFAGNLEYDCRKLPASRIRTNINYRTQYGNDFSTLYASIDYREKTGKLGLGATFIQDEYGLGPVSNTQASLVASYKIPIDLSWQIHTGVQIGYQYRNVNLGRFVFPEQISDNGISNSSNANLLNGADARFLDLGLGGLIFNDKMYIGLAAHHLNRPNQSFRGDSVQDPLEVKLSIHGGYKIMLNKSKGFKKSRKPEKSITPTCHFRYQKPFRQLELGTFVNLEPAIFGLWYRGLPLIKGPDGRFNQEAICVMAGAKLPTDYGLLRLGISYDYPVGNNISSLGQTFELSLGYQFIDERCRKRIVYRRIPNPDL